MSFRHSPSEGRSVQELLSLRRDGQPVFFEIHRQTAEKIVLLLSGDRPSFLEDPLPDPSLGNTSFLAAGQIRSSGANGSRTLVIRLGCEEERVRHGWDGPRDPIERHALVAQVQRELSQLVTAMNIPATVTTDETLPPPLSPLERSARLWGDAIMAAFHQSMDFCSRCMDQPTMRGPARRSSPLPTHHRARAY